MFELDPFILIASIFYMHKLKPSLTDAEIIAPEMVSKPIMSLLGIRRLQL